MKNKIAENRLKPYLEQNKLDIPELNSKSQSKTEEITKEEIT
jgi:hypothetical protein